MQKTLSEWAVEYIKNKDLVQKRLVNIETTESLIICKYKAGEGTYFIEPTLSEKVLAEIKEEECTVVCLNKKENLSILIKNWERFAKFKKLCFIFVNPLINERWIIFPYTHNLITEYSSLKRGLQSLFCSVEEVNG